MNRSASRSLRRLRALACVPVVFALALSACSDEPDAGAEPDVDAGAAADPAALECEGGLTFWTWVPNIEETIALFEEEYPDIPIELVNAGQGADHYTQLRTTLTAGTGAPDVAQMEYKNLPGFVLTDSLVDLSEYGAAELEDRFVPSAWDQVTVGEGVYGIPQDTGPMIMLYRPDVFEELGLEVPTTWEEYEEAGRQIQAAGPDRYLSFIDPGDAGGASSMLWQAGSRPFALEGADNTELTIDFQDDGAQMWAENWTTLVEEDLVEVAPGFTDEWYRALADGRYATWIVGAWGPTFLQSVIPQTEGQWRVAPMPQYGEGESVAAEHGGSSVAVTTQSDCPEAATEFAVWLNSDPAAAQSLNENSLLYPATTELVESEEFLNAEDAFLGGQQANQIYAEAGSNVGEGWQYTPFQDYAESVFGDTVGQALTGSADLSEGLQDWGAQLREYATEQGFQVSGG